MTEYIVQHASAGGDPLVGAGCVENLDPLVTLQEYTVCVTEIQICEDISNFPAVTSPRIPQIFQITHKQLQNRKTEEWN